MDLHLLSTKHIMTVQAENLQYVPMYLAFPPFTFHQQLYEGPHGAKICAASQESATSQENVNGCACGCWFSTGNLLNQQGQKVHEENTDHFMYWQLG